MTFDEVIAELNIVNDGKSDDVEALAWIYDNLMDGKAPQGEVAKEFNSPEDECEHEPGLIDKRYCHKCGVKI